jgi:anaerobic selenocysteine-containing dehydrogenase
VEDGKAVGFYADPDHPVTQGWLCAKVRPYLDHVYHPDRIQYPMRREGPKGSGKWRRVTWDEALAEIAAKWRAIIQESGPEAILPYSYSGTLGMLQMAISSGRFWNRLGASRLQRSICGAAAELAVEATLGKRWSPPYEDVLHSKLVILWGSNPSSTGPHFMPFLRKAQQAGCKLVAIDPRRSASAQGADLQLAPLPGTDGILAMGLARLLVKERLHDEIWLQGHTVGWEKLRASLEAFPLERVVRQTGVPADTVLQFAQLYGKIRPGLIKIGDGVNRNLNGGQNVRAICALPAITGQFGKLGAGLAYSTSGYVQWKDPAGASANCPPPGREINMNRLGAALLGEAKDPPIRSLFVFGANPATSSPNAALIRRGLAREDLFTVVHELFMTDTAEWADLVLPATSQLEQVDLHKAYGTTQLTYNAQAIAPLGECKSNWNVMRLLAKAMNFNEPWLAQEANEVIAEVLAATAKDNPHFAGVTLERLMREGSVGLSLPAGPPFADGRFPTQSSKVELFSSVLDKRGIDPLPGVFREAEDDGGVNGHSSKWPAEESLWLVTQASHHFVSSSFASQKGLLESAGPPRLEIHPEDALRRQIGQGDWIEVANGRGAFTLQAKVTDAVRPGVVATPKGRWARLSGGSCANFTTSDALADLAGQSTFHSNRVWVKLHDSNLG